MIEPFDFEVDVARVEDYRAIVVAEHDASPAGSVPVSYVVVPALIASHGAMAAVGWDPDAATLRHVAVEAVIDAPLTTGSSQVSTDIRALGRLGRGTGLAFSIRIDQHGRTAASLRSVIQSADAAEPNAADFALADHVGGIASVGQAEHSAMRTFSPSEVTAYAELVGDRVALHHDVEVARSQGLEHPIVPGYLTAAAMAEVVAAASGAGLAGFATRFRHPVPVGAEVTIDWSSQGQATLAAVREQGNDLVRGRVDLSLRPARNPGVR